MRVILCLLTALVATPAWAEWVKYKADDIQTFYYDPATVKNHGEFLRVFAVVDYKKATIDGVKSYRVFNEYDCKDERSRQLEVTGHTGAMVTGNTIYSADRASVWRETPLKSANWELLRLVCGQ